MAVAIGAVLFVVSLRYINLADTIDDVLRLGFAFPAILIPGCAWHFLRTWGWTGALDVYSLADPASPAFVASQSVAGNAGDIVVVGGRAYAPGGMYGVQSFDLAK